VGAYSRAHRTLILGSRSAENTLAWYEAGSLLRTPFLRFGLSLGAAKNERMKRVCAFTHVSTFGSFGTGTVACVAGFCLFFCMPSLFEREWRYMVIGMTSHYWLRLTFTSSRTVA